MKLLFLHGWHSVIGGVKPTHLKDAGHEVINPALDDDDLDAALRTAQAEYDQHHVPPGSGPPPHIHSREEESFLVLEGEMTFQLGDERFTAGEGTFLNMPVGSLHCFKNESDKTARLLISLAPAGLEEMFFEVGTPLAHDADIAPPPSEGEIKRLLEAAPRYGVEIKVPHH